MNVLAHIVAERRSLALSVFAFLLTMTAGASIVLYMEAEDVQVERTKAGYTTDILAGKVRNVVDELLYITRTMEALLHEGDGKIRNFDEAMHIVTQGRSVRNVALAPNGVISQVYPLHGNEEALGHNLFSDPARQFETERTKRSRMLTLAGPFKLRQGGLGAVGRLPVFLPSPDGEAFFWGMVCVTIDFPAALAPAGLDALEKNGMAYELWRSMPEDGSKQMIAHSALPLVGNAVNKTVELPNSAWTLSITPAAGWGGKSKLFLRMGVALLIALLVGFLVKGVLDLATQRRILEKLSRTDALTGLSNRRALFDRLLYRLSLCSQNGRNLALCYIDINGFKGINDTFGHDVGDVLLIEVAKRLREVMDDPDDLARLGGDEFVFLHEYEAEEEIAAITGRIEAQMRKPFPLGETELSVSLSIGISCYPCDGKTADQLMRCADQQMYRMKRQIKQNMASLCKADEKVN